MACEHVPDPAQDADKWQAVVNAFKWSHPRCVSSLVNAVMNLRVSQNIKKLLPRITL
jgi:hypothetical protein